MERFEVEKIFMEKNKNGFTPIFVLKDGREIQAVWNPTGSCWVTTFEMSKKESFLEWIDKNIDALPENTFS